MAHQIHSCHPPQSPSHGVKPLKRGILPRHIGRTKGGLNTKLHAVCDGMGRPIALCLTAGQTSDHLGAKILYPVLPDGPDITLIGDKGYDSDDYRAALRAKGITACIPPRKGRNSPASFCKIQYNNAIRSKPCSGGSKIGDALQHDMIDGPTFSWPQSQLQSSSHIGFNEA